LAQSFIAMPATESNNRTNVISRSFMTLF
jgi:hypothetical protein